VLGTFLYQIWGKPVLPKPKVSKCRLDFSVKLQEPADKGVEYPAYWSF
jgi:hypothetical protein